MKDDFEIKDPLILNERIFTVCGVWPQKRLRGRFAAAVVYLGLVTVLQYWDLYDCMGDFDTAVINVTETMLTTSMYACFVIMQRSKQLDVVITTMRRHIADSQLFEDKEERRLYHGYNVVARRVSKYGIMAASATAYLMYMRPLMRLLRDLQGQGNGTVSYHLPFRTHIIFDYTTDTRMYSLVYLYQFPITYVAVSHATEVSFIANLVLHFCGRLSVLSYRIRNISTTSCRSFNDGIREAVVQHLELTQSLRSLNDSISVLLLLEVLGCCSRLGLAMFVVLVKFGTDLAVAINFTLYSFDQIIWLYLYCYIGEQTTLEAQKVGDAFYEIDWPAVNSNDKKALSICILNGYKQLHITASKVYTFSLFGFTSIIKTSMACLSVLQANM